MATPWDRINNHDFRTWLTEAGTSAEEYNSTSPLERAGLLTVFKQQQQQQQLLPCYLVTVTTEGRKGRRALFKLASGGYYPVGMDPTSAFARSISQSTGSASLLSASVVFSNLRSAEAFIVKVDKYMVSTRGRITYHTPFNSTHVEPYDNHRLILQSDYIPNQANGEAPQDLPVWVSKSQFHL